MHKAKVLIVISLLLSTFVHAQNADYQKLNVTVNFGGPILDTLTTAYKLGEMRTRPQDSKLYRWNGHSWDLMYYGVANLKTPNLDAVLSSGNTSSAGITVGLSSFAGIKVPSLGVSEIGRAH